jgi:glycosyltransferase involved in cell wall biosynthesis
MNKVSVIIPTYNRYTQVKTSIESCLNQTYENIEVIVVNDCSTDNMYYTGELEKYPKTIIIHLPINQRVKYNTAAAQGKTRQEGMKHATGEWIAFLDDDDCFLPEKIETQLKELAKHPDILFCSTNMITGIVRNNEWMTGGDFRPYLSLNLNLPSIFKMDLIKQVNYINNSSVLIHKSICDKVGEFKYGVIEDYDYWLRALVFTDCLYIDQMLVYYDSGCNKYYNYNFS